MKKLLILGARTGGTIMANKMRKSYPGMSGDDNCGGSEQDTLLSARISIYTFWLL